MPNVYCDNNNECFIYVVELLYNANTFSNCWIESIVCCAEYLSARYNNRKSKKPFKDAIHIQSIDMLEVANIVIIIEKVFLLSKHRF